MKLFRQFLVRLGVPAALDEKVPLERRESKYAVGEVFVSLLYAVVLDLKRQSDTILLRLDQVFQQITGLRGYPAQSTISRFLKQLTVRAAKAIGEVNLLILWKARREFQGWQTVTLDLDSHARTPKTSFQCS